MQQPSLPPRYLSLASDLRRQIESGAFKPGDRVPSEAQLSAENGVSRGTVVRAIEKLVDDGIIHRRQGSGSFVSRPSLRRRAGKVLSFTDSAKGEGMLSEHVLISSSAATSEQVAEFNVGGPAHSLVRLRLLDGFPCAIHRSLVPASMAQNLPALNGKRPAELEQRGFSLYKAFDGAGFTVCNAQERAMARLANGEERSLLKLDHPSAVMVVFRRSYAQDGRLLEVVEAVYRGDYYTFDMQLVLAADRTASQNTSSLDYQGGRISKPKSRRM